MDTLLQSLEEWREGEGHSQAFIAGTLAITPQAYSLWLKKGAVPSRKRTLIRKLLTLQTEVSSYKQALDLLPDAAIIELITLRAKFLAPATRFRLIGLLADTDR